MCPARRPGYTDQWLIPLIKEFALRYDADAIHHDYVRYPGDLAPDTYCFCDYCLEQIPKYAGYYSPAHPDHALLAPMDRPHIEAHWERSPKVLPPNWNEYTCGMKSSIAGAAARGDRSPSAPWSGVSFALLTRTTSPSRTARRRSTRECALLRKPSASVPWVTGPPRAVSPKAVSKDWRSAISFLIQESSLRQAASEVPGVFTHGVSVERGRSHRDSDCRGGARAASGDAVFYQAPGVSSGRDLDRSGGWPVRPIDQ